MKKLSKVFVSFIIMLMVIITPINTQKVFAVAGSPGDFPLTATPPTTSIVASDYFTVAGSSNAFIHPDYGNVIVVNRNVTNQLGAMWSKEKISLNSKFSYEAYMYIGSSADRATSNADGMTFTMQNDPNGTSSIGSNGHGLGAYTVSGRANGIRNAISFEIDTLNQTFDTGLTSRHTGFVVPTDPNGGNKHYEVKYFNEYDDAQGGIISRWVSINSTWTPNANGSADLTISLNGVSSTHHFDNYVNYFGGDSVYFGYTGGTGSSTEMHAIALAKMPSNYYMHFDLNSTDLAGQTIDSQMLAIGEYAQPVVAPTRTGYTLESWNTSADGSGVDWDFANMAMSEGDLTLYAQWKLNKHQLVFDLQNADSSAIDPQDVNYNELATAVTNPTKLGYTFMGWNTKNDGTGTNWDLTTTKMPDNSVTLYAQWQANKYTLTFDLQKADSAAINPQDVNCNELATNVTNPIKQGYTFMGWNTKSDGTGTNWDLTTTKMPANSVTIYAQWQVNEYKLEFNLNSGDGSTPNTQFIDFGLLAVEPTTPKKQGYTFKGWNTKKDGSGTTWDFKSTVMPANNVILYAQWEKNEEIQPIDIPKTGDDSKVALLSSLLISIAVSLLVIRNKNRKIM